MDTHTSTEPPWLVWKQTETTSLTRSQTRTSSKGLNLELFWFNPNQTGQGKDYIYPKGKFHTFMHEAVSDRTRPSVPIQTYTNWNERVNTINHLSAPLAPRNCRRGNFPPNTQHSLFIRFAICFMHLILNYKVVNMGLKLIM